MDFSLSDEQVALAELARDLFAKLYPTSVLRELWEGADRDPQAWRSMAAASITGLLVPDPYGGAGGTPLDLVVMLEEAGRALVPEPLLDTAVGAAVLLRQGGALAERWLPAVAAGDATISVLLAGDAYATDADVADLLLVEQDGELTAVEGAAAATTRVQSEDRSRRLFSVHAPPGEPAGPAATALLYGALGSAALLVGITAALLDQTLAYVKVRSQFGVPVGSFQAVKHKLATVYAELESARAATWYAAYSLTEPRPDGAAAVMSARILAGEVEARANTEALQCHGGIGFTQEHDLHLWLKRGRALEHTYGSAREHRRALGTVLLG